MTKHLKYLRYVLRHKWFVFREGLKLNVPILRLIFHDWTKFLPCEWFPYVEMFYGGQPGSVSTESVSRAFDLAWDHHQKHNDHHWQWWVLILDDGGAYALAMSDSSRREMLADWRGAGLALGLPDTHAWYLKNQDNMMLHPDTRAWIERYF